MQESSLKNIKLGVFVIVGLFLLVWLLYLIGINRNLFGAHFELKATFRQVNGLEVGNNVRFAGINAGTVDEINMVNDSTIEVSMLLNNKYSGIIKRNAEAGISTDGLVGNKIINIVTHKGNAALAKNGDHIATIKNTDTEEMIRTLAVSNNNIRKVTDSLLFLVSSVNNSSNLNYLMHNPRFKDNIDKTLQLTRKSMSHLHTSSVELAIMLKELNQGKGNLGKILKDTLLYTDINHSVQSIQFTAENLNRLIDSSQQAIQLIQSKIKDKNNTIGKLMNDTAMSNELNETVHHINQSAQHFDEIMRALQNSFLLRKHFRKINNPDNTNH